MGTEFWPSSSRSSNVQPPWEREPGLQSIVRNPSEISPGHIVIGGIDTSPEFLHRSPQRLMTTNSSLLEDELLISQSSTLPSQNNQTSQKLIVRTSTTPGYSPTNPYLSVLAEPSEALYGNTLTYLHSLPANSETFSPPIRTLPPWSELCKSKAGVTNPYLNSNLHDSTTACNPTAGFLSRKGPCFPGPPSSSGQKADLHSVSKLEDSVSLPGNEDAWLQKFQVHGGVTEAEVYSNKPYDRCFYLLNVPTSQVKSSLSSSSVSNPNQLSPPSRLEAIKGSRTVLRVPSSTLEGTGSSSSLPIQLPVKMMEVNGSLVTVDMKKSNVPSILSKDRKASLGGILNRSQSAIGSSASVTSPLNRNMSFESVTMERTQGGPEPRHTKARSLVDGVIESLVEQLVSGKCRPNVLAHMIFCNLKSSSAAAMVGPFTTARLLVERILLIQLRGLTHKLMLVASDDDEFDAQKWALKTQNNRKNEEGLSNEGLRLLRLQKRYLEIGLETFDVLCKIKNKLPHLAAEDTSCGQGVLKIACNGGGPGCGALALYLFFQLLSPSLEVQVDIFAGDSNLKEVVDGISLKGIKFVGMDALQNPSLLRSYKLIAFVNYLGEKPIDGPPDGQCQAFWDKIYLNTTAMAVIIVYETVLRWEDIMPNRGQWWCGSAPDQDTSVHIVRKI
eukprot:c12780_g1_i1 orf=364-2376(-)